MGVETSLMGVENLAQAFLKKIFIYLAAGS